MLNNSKINHFSSVKKNPNFLTTNMNSTSKEKFISNNPKNTLFNTNNKENMLKNSALKISFKTDFKGKICFII